MKGRHRPIVQWYVFFVATAATVLLMVASWDVPTDDLGFRNALTAFLILALISEAGFLRIGKASQTSSVAFIPHLASVVLFAPAWTMVLAGSSMLLVDSIVRRKPAVKVLHNTSKEIIGIGLSSYCYVALGGHPNLSTFAPSAPGFLAAVIIYFLVSQGATVVATALSSGEKVSDTWRQLVGGSLIYDLMSGPVALFLAVLYVKQNLIGVLLFIVPLLVVRHLFQINLRLERVNADLLQLMVKAIEARDPYTSGHSLRVSKLARALAQELTLPARKVEQIATAALLHDVGKIYQEFATLLRKEGPLLPHEKQMMQSHPVRSAELVSTISTLRGDVELAVRHHHESFDGSGYPDGLMADEIPIGSRIIAIADTVDAMTTDRPYRKALPYRRVAAELQAFRLKQFDPNLVDLFCSSPRIQILVDTHLRRTDDPQPKTVADTFDDLRRALGSIPTSIADGGSTRWQRPRLSGGLFRAGEEPV